MNLSGSLEHCDFPVHRPSVPQYQYHLSSKEVNMSRFMTLVVLAALFSGTTGCASDQAQRQKPFAGLPFRNNGYDFKKAWKASPSPQGLAIELVLKNIRYPRVEELEVNVSLLKKGDKVIAEETAFLPRIVATGEYCNFTILLKNVTAAPGDLLHFRISYSASEGSNAYKTVSDFTADAVTGVTPRQQQEMISSDE
jgi:hypothetical protein